MAYMLPQLSQPASSHWAQFSSSPTISPPSTAPTMESSPPRMTAATEETTAEIAQDMANTFGTETPSDCATCWSKAVARIASPCFEAVKNQAKPAMISTEMP